MFDFTSVSKREEFTFWFERLSESKWSVVTNDETHESVGEMVETGKSASVHIACDDLDAEAYEEIKSAIKENFSAFVNGRPEYMVGKHIDAALIEVSPINDDRMVVMRDVYETLIAGIFYLTYDEERVPKLAERCIKWLASTDFYTAPASTIYHDAEPSGLLRHSLRVADKMIELLSIPSFSRIKMHEAILTALAHDWCKIDLYEQYMKNVKDDATGVWNKVPAYRHKGSPLPFGHGVTSMFMVQKFFKLSTEQALAIRWHMNRWNTCEKELVELCAANEKYPMVHLLQFADQLSMTAFC